MASWRRAPRSRPSAPRSSRRRAGCAIDASPRGSSSAAPCRSSRPRSAICQRSTSACAAGAGSDSQTGTLARARAPRAARRARHRPGKAGVGDANRDGNRQRPGRVEHAKRRARRLVVDRESRRRGRRRRAAATPAPRDGETDERAENDGSSDTVVHGVADTAAMSPMRPNVAPSSDLTRSRSPKPAQAEVVREPQASRKPDARGIGVELPRMNREHRGQPRRFAASIVRRTRRGELIRSPQPQPIGITCPNRSATSGGTSVIGPAAFAVHEDSADSRPIADDPERGHARVDVEALAPPARRAPTASGR